ncbi:glycosyltransferase family 2 protein [Micropruina sp.]|uniref:glycosyltransferase family 2 protein n=1 Tax=Micropruina sp. TaxID=2737536 RepID=UPI0039E586B1
MSLRAAVVIASAGRPELLAELAENLAVQTYPITAKVASVPDEKSLPEARMDGWEILIGVRGASAQRNAGIDALNGAADVVFVFDDDSVVRHDYIAQAIHHFEQNPGVLALTGRVVLDGATGGEIPQEVAKLALAASEDEPLTGRSRPSRTLYGCNFAFRLAAVPDMRFDERLPLYSWLEDHDFARRLMRRGELAKVDDCVIVHRGAGSGGRTNHVRLGYSQVMNPIYLHRKGSFPLWLMMLETVPRTMKNVVRAVFGSEKEWRRARVRGNLLALGDALIGRITPERITEL